MFLGQETRWLAREVCKEAGGRAGRGDGVEPLNESRR